MKRECPRCHGTGEIDHNPDPRRNPEHEVSDTCMVCGGSGGLEASVRELRSRIAHDAGPTVPAEDFMPGCVIGSPDGQAPTTIRRVERTGRNGNRKAA